MADIRTAISITDQFSPALRAMNQSLGLVMSSLADTQAQLGKPIDTSVFQSVQEQLAESAVMMDQLTQKSMTMAGKLSKEFDGASSATSKLGVSASTAKHQQDGLNNSMSAGATAASNLMGMLKGVIGAYATWQGVTSFIQTSDQLTGISARLNLLTGDLEKTEALQDQIFQAAERSRGSYTDMANVVGKLGANASDAFANTDEMVTFAESLSNHFTIAGASTEEMNSAMLQLTQGLGAGALRGEELNAVLEAAPNIIQTIANYMGVPKGKIKELASEGMLTANIIKDAMLGSVDRTREALDSMPKTFGQIWTSFKNNALVAFDPIFLKIRQLASSDGFNSFVQTAISAVKIVADGVIWAVEAIGSIFSFIKQNMNWIAPILWGIGAALAFQAAMALWAKREILLNAAATAWKTICDWAQWAATFALIAAQYGLNTALAMCPITWIIGAIIALVVVFYLAVAAVNHFAGTSISATGLICGAFMFLYAMIYNIVANLWNTFAIFAEFLVNVFKNPIYSIKALFVNLAVNFLDNCISMTKGWDNFATSIVNAFITAINWVLDGWNWLVDKLGPIADKIGIGKATKFEARTSITSDLTNARDALTASLGEKPDDYWTAPRMEFKDVGATTLKGYNWGEDLVSKITGGLSNLDGYGQKELENLKKEYGTDSLTDLSKMLANDKNLTDSASGGTGSGSSGSGGSGGVGSSDFAKKYPEIAKKLDSIVGNTSSIESNEEELKYMRELSQREAVNRFTTAEIKVDARSSNSIASNMDVDGVINYFTEKLREAMSSAAEGVHT